LNGEQAGRCQSDEEVSIATFPCEEREDGMVYLRLPPVHELDGVLGTKKWMVKKGESGEGPFEKLDRRIGKNGIGMKGRKPFEAKKELVGAIGGPGEGNIDW
jgi:nitrite reductase (NAD(P)H)